METSIQYRSFQQKFHPKDASVSSYLRPQPPPPPPKSPPSITQEDIACTVDDSDQISVFDAENYFSESNEHKEINNRSSSSSSQAVSVINLNGYTDQRSEFSTVSRLSSISSVDGYGNGRNYRAHSFHATPTASSEASWNSQTGLLSNPPGSIAVSLKNLPVPDNQRKKGERSSSAMKWFGGRRCPCSGKKSVEVKEKSPTTRIRQSKSESNRSVIQSEFSWNNPTSRAVFAEQQSVKSQKSSITQDVVERPEKVVPDLRRFSNSAVAAAHQHQHQHQHRRHFNDGNGFSFPILNQSSKLILKGTPTTSNSIEDPPRDSLEVFQPPDESISGKSMAVQQRALVAHGGVETDRRGFAFPTSPISRITTPTEDDVASDASSDLFEIESLSTQPPLPSYPMYCRRDSLDEATTFNARRLAANCRLRSLDETAPPSIAATECYEPSEASIDWSVTTAEGFDRASVTNLSVTASDMEDLAIIRHGKGGGGGDGSKRRLGNYGGLLSCRCEKAVSVGPQPVEEEGRRAVVGGWRHVGVGGGGDSTSSSRPQPYNRDVNKPPLGRSRSARLSLAFAT